MSLWGEVAIVTGAGKGIGRAIALALAEEGIAVAVTSRVTEDAEALAEELGEGHLGIGMDVRSTASVNEAVARAAETLGPPTILVNNAGVNRLGPSESVSDEDWEFVLDTNLTGVFRCCRAVGALMIDTGRGSIVNVASITGPVVGMPWRAAYASSKGGVVGLTRALASEWGQRGVRVNAVLPGPVRTPMVEAAIERGILDEEAITARSPMGRMGVPEDVAGAVLMLCSPGAVFVNGQALVVDGGYASWGAAHPIWKDFGDLRR